MMVTPYAANDIAELDQLGPVLCRLGAMRVTLCWVGPRDSLPGYYFVDGRDADGRFFAGLGETPSAALAAATRHAAVAASGGIYVDA